MGILLWEVKKFNLKEVPELEMDVIEVEHGDDLGDKKIRRITSKMPHDSSCMWCRMLEQRIADTETTMSEAHKMHIKLETNGSCLY